MELSLAYLPQWLLLVGAGIAAGFVNTMAGGGSMLTLPALMLLGMDASIANGTNRLSIVTQSISGVWGFHRRGRLPTAAITPIVLPTVVGAGVGASLAAIAPEPWLKPVLLSTLVGVAVIMVFRPNFVPVDPEVTPLSPQQQPKAWFGLFLAGAYGGFIQAGVGLVLLSVLCGVLRYDAARGNALKLVCTLLFGSLALGIFILADLVAWGPACVLAVATVIGSQLGVHFTLRLSPRTLRGILLLAVSAACAAAFLKS